MSDESMKLTGVASKVENRLIIGPALSCCMQQGVQFCNMHLECEAYPRFIIKRLPFSSLQGF